MISVPSGDHRDGHDGRPGAIERVARGGGQVPGAFASIAGMVRPRRRDDPGRWAPVTWGRLVWYLRAIPKYG